MPPFAVVARQSDLPRSIIVASQTKPVCATQLKAPPPNRNQLLAQDEDIRGQGEYQQSLPPGTHRPEAPEVLVQVSCLRLVAATQQEPLGTGRPAFCRSLMTDADVRVLMTRMRVVMEKCILRVCWEVR
jgi:hypothetical protein